MEINKVTAINDDIQLLNVTITKGLDSYKYQMNTPVLSGDALQAHCDSEEYKHLNNILYQLYGRNIQFPNNEPDREGGDYYGWDEWIADGCKIAEVKGEDKEGNEIVITPEKVITKTVWVDLH